MKNFVFIFSLLLTTTVFAQGFTFRVLASKGANQIKKADGSTVALKTGATLADKDELVAANGAYIGLMHKTGKTIEVRQPGSHTMASLEQKVAAKNVSVASKYAQFIAGKMNEDGDVSVASRMNATGAVSRAVGGGITMFVPTETVEALGNEIVLRWERPVDKDVDADYTVMVLDIFDEAIFEGNTSEEILRLDLSSLNNETGLYRVKVTTQVAGEDVSSEFIGIKEVDIDEREDLVTEYNNLKEEVTGQEALDLLIYASFYEENGMILDAISTYDKLVNKYPDVEDFKSYYEALMVGYNFY